ncbi:MAG: bifunctional metallophosphatase/5'-nucleotidase [Deltaproteobacteria bacterium]|nr:bifunctional metallophosphatase/5'-nucleotidase [Deltaproteobacteria bacterium]
MTDPLKMQAPMLGFRLIAVVVLLFLGSACTVERKQPQLKGQDVRVTFIHTSDIHSRLFPYHFVPGYIEQQKGLKLGEGPYGGIARIGHIVREERARAARSIWLDSGDCFQGAPVFNLYRGEAEFRALTELGLDGAVIGNHEFDLGSNNLYEQMVNWAGFPLLAANYYFEDPSEPTKPKLREVVEPFRLYDLDGVKIAVIGMANQSSLTSIVEGGNSLGIRPLSDAETVKRYVGLLRPVADLVVLVSHLGLDEDEGLAESEVDDENEQLPLDGVDLVLGGHLHIVLDPPKILRVDEHEHPTILVHSGAFAKYVGRLDTVVRMGEDNSNPAKRSYFTGFTYQAIPVTCGKRARPTDPCPNPSDADTLALLQPYALELNQILDLDGVFAYINTKGQGAESKIQRSHPSGGDSQLGNLVARAMQSRPGVDADFALTNSLGIRSDFEQGPLDLEALYNVFPFENSITIMFLSGVEVIEMLNFVARKSSDRGCRTQAQVAGISFKMICGRNPRAEEIYLGENCRKEDGSIDTTACVPLLENGLYRVAVNDYIAGGGSGFTVLKRNTSKQNTGIALRAALMDYIRQLPSCPPDLVDASSGENKTVLAKHGNIACLDETIEPHDARILPSLE